MVDFYKAFYKERESEMMRESAVIKNKDVYENEMQIILYLFNS